VQTDVSASASAEAEVDTGAPLRSPETPPTLADGVSLLAVPCDPDGTEACNALDDDCDNVVDEGCGYAHGPMQITVAWNSGADLDLYLTEPSGETVSPQELRTASGAHLDQAGRGACAPDLEVPRVENVYWEQRPASGPYELELHYLMECDTHAGPTTVTLSLVVAEELVGTYNYTLAPNERVRVLAFELP